MASNLGDPCLHVLYKMYIRASIRKCFQIALFVPNSRQFAYSDTNRPPVQANSSEYAGDQSNWQQPVRRPCEKQHLFQLGTIQVARIAANRVNTRSDAICGDSEARGVLKPPPNAPVRAVFRRFFALWLKNRSNVRVRRRRAGPVAAVHKPLLLMTSLARAHMLLRPPQALSGVSVYVRYFATAPRPASWLRA